MHMFSEQVCRSCVHMNLTMHEQYALKKIFAGWHTCLA